MRCRVGKVRLGYEHVLQVRLGRPRSIKSQKKFTYYFPMLQILRRFLKSSSNPTFSLWLLKPIWAVDKTLSIRFLSSYDSSSWLPLVFCKSFRKAFCCMQSYSQKKKFNYKNVFKFEKAPILTVIYVVLAHKIQWVPLNGILDNRIHLLMRSKFTSIVKSKTTLNT